ncbi:CD151 antigen-like [Asterias rubens]|uniref:CD151 antigen-like n=1 Tax=Asterias rubens TaxID=7604 RepID=UPI001455B9B5|nr:CD151 antigen-like [Asterias rubens]XP_033646026.1 CD151 antigen-like [Asterias rubens]
MATTTCGTCSKIVLFIVNFVFWLSGIAVLGLGIWVSIDRNTLDFLRLFDFPILRNLGFAMIGIGFFVTILGFIGCFGACHESKCMLWTYFVCVLFLILAEIVCIALTFSYTQEVKDFVKGQMHSSLIQEYSTTRNGFVKSVDGMQAQLMCCGNSNHLDWQQSQWYNEVKNAENRGYNTTVPDSCCVRDLTDDGEYTYKDRQKCQGSEPSEFRFQQGCYDALYGTFFEYIWLLGGICIGIAVLQVLILIVTVFLLRNLTDDYD